MQDNSHSHCAVLCCAVLCCAVLSCTIHPDATADTGIQEHEIHSASSPGRRGRAGYLGACPSVHPIVRQCRYDVSLQGGGPRPQERVDHPKKRKRQRNQNDQDP